MCSPASLHLRPAAHPCVLLHTWQLAPCLLRPPWDASLPHHARPSASFVHSPSLCPAQAAIPRTDLIQVLEKAGKLADVLGSYAQGVQVGSSGLAKHQVLPVAACCMLPSRPQECRPRSSREVPCHAKHHWATVACSHAHALLDLPATGQLPRGRCHCALLGRPCPHRSGRQRWHSRRCACAVFCANLHMACDECASWLLQEPAALAHALPACNLTL